MIHPNTLLGLLLLTPIAAAAQSKSTPAALADQTVALDKFTVTADKEKNFSLPLDASAPSASRLGLTIRQMPTSVSIVSQEMMQLRGLRTALEAVEAVVGMTGGNQSATVPNYSTRGFGGNNVTIMRDGIRQNVASQSSRPLDTFILDRIEILKGPDGLMFGEGAIGGAVNYVSKSPSENFRGEAFASYGNWDSYRLGVGIGGPVGTSGLSYRADYSRNETGGYYDRSTQRYDAAAFSLKWKTSERLTLTWYGTYLDDHTVNYYGVPVVYDAVVNTTVAGALPEVRLFNANTDRMVNPRVAAGTGRTNYNILDAYANSENAFGRLRAEFGLADGIDLRNETYAATQLLKWRNSEVITWNPVTQLLTRANTGLIYRDDVLLGNRLNLLIDRPVAGMKNRFSVGALIENNDQIRGNAQSNVVLTNAPVSLLTPALNNGASSRFQKNARVRVRTHAFYLENSLEVNPSLRLVGGLRHDDIDLRRDTLFNPTATPATQFSSISKNYRPVTGRVGAVWSATKQLNLYAAYSRAADPVVQLVSITGSSADYALQKGRQFEVGAKGTFLDGKLDTTLALYDIEKADLLTSTFDPITSLRVSQQIGAQSSRGVELALALSPAQGWRIEGNAAYTDARYDTFNENLGTGIISRAGNRPINVPEWVANVFVSRTLANGLTLSGGPRYVSERFANNNNSVVAEGYVVLDAGVTFTWKRTAFTLRGRNLLDETYEPAAGSTSVAMRRYAEPASVEFSVRTLF